jgi:hypothetical protein
MCRNAVAAPQCHHPAPSRPRPPSCHHGVLVMRVVLTLISESRSEPPEHGMPWPTRHPTSFPAQAANGQGVLRQMEFHADRPTTFAV